MLKLALPLAPQAAASAAPYMVWLAVLSILYGAVLALREQDPKRLIAYSSLSHMGYIVLGIFSFQQAALHGAMLQMLSHGVAVTGLFLLLGALELRGGTADRLVGALASTAPRLAVVLMLFVLTSLALPLTSGFTAEFLVLFGAFSRGIAVWRADGSTVLLTAAVLASTAMVLGAAYMLRFARSIVFDKRGDPLAIGDLTGREISALAAPLLLIAWIGVAPAGLTTKAQSAVSQLAAIPTSHQTGPNMPRAIMPVIARTEDAHGQ
jgi:NADH-quinone oxidoreductase subunit M